MQEEHRKAIQNNFISLVEQTDLDVMVAALYEKGVFSEQMKEVYEDTNKDVRNRKRSLYRDITRRGPHAFGHLLDALRENGYWDFVRDLDPNSSLHPLRSRNPAPGTSKSSGDSNYVSIRTEKNKTKTGSDVNKNVTSVPVSPAPFELKDVVDPTEIPRFEVKKSQKFVEDNNGGIALYRTRGRQRGLLVVFSYIEFDGIEPHRSGADVDCKKLKYLFTEFGFKVLVYQDLTKEETLETLHGLKEAVVGVECLFIVVSSHGHGRAHSSDNDFRCRKGGLISLSYVLERFNNRNLPALRGVPKVFIFQLCRGSNEDYLTLPAGARSDGARGAGGAQGERPRGGQGRGGRAAVDGTPCPASPPPQRLPQPLERDPRDRVYSDILIAHSTIPGNVSYRDEAEGSWYISALCEVFAEAAHERHVEELFTLVDQRLHASRRVQTSSVDRWGFNRRLYLHPGLYERD